MKHGLGKFNYSDGGIYAGEWAEDMKNGQGKLVDADGKVHEGVWKDGYF